MCRRLTIRIPLDLIEIGWLAGALLRLELFKLDIIFQRIGDDRGLQTLSNKLGLEVGFPFLGGVFEAVRVRSLAGNDTGMKNRYYTRTLCPTF